MNKKTKAILVVSFGTSHEDTRIKTIDAIRKEIEESFPEYEIYEAWTSKMIMAKIAKRDGIHIDNVVQAMERMEADGVTEVILQPTHVINGIENDFMKEDALQFENQFNKITFGNPLLTTQEDNDYVMEVIASEFADLGAEESLVLMGHGSTHYVNSIYAALDYGFKDRGNDNIFVGTVEAYPSLETVMKFVKKHGTKKVVLAPFMIVAGDHAKNDLAGEEEDSWYSKFTDAGFQVRCVLKGLGEYEEIRKLFVQHIQAVR